MAYFQNDDLEYIVNDYYDDVEFEEDIDAFADNQPRGSIRDSDDDDDFEDLLDSSKVESDTSSLEARNGKDIQGIPWERLNFTRDKYREARLKQYKNYESLASPRQDFEKGGVRAAGETLVICWPLSRVQISTMAVKEDLLVAGSFQGELICKVGSCCFQMLTVDAKSFIAPKNAKRLKEANKVQIEKLNFLRCIASIYICKPGRPRHA